MKECIDYWCEHYGSNNCTQCKSNENVPDKHDLRVILKRRADKMMEIDVISDKNMEQSR